MKIFKSSSLELTQKVVSLSANSRELSVGLLFSFSLQGQTETRPIKDLVWRLAKKAIGEKTVFDEGLPKYHSEFLAFGTCYPGEGSLQPVSASVSVGPIQKQLVVYGNRYFKAGGGISTPEPFSEMPIIPENAYGGKGYAMNQKGKGVSSGSDNLQQSLPNIETLKHLMAHPRDEVPVSGFWPLGADHPDRLRLLGKFDQTWFRTRWPDLPLDTSPDYFQVAPKDQRASGYFLGNESITIRNMHESISELRSNLPSVRMRLIYEDTQETANQLHEVATSCETVYLFPNDLFGLVLYRGIIPLGSNSDAADFKIYADAEPLSSPRLDVLDVVDRILGGVSSTPDLSVAKDEKKPTLKPADSSADQSKQSKDAVVQPPEEDILQDKLQGIQKTVDATLSKLGLTKADLDKAIHNKKVSQLNYKNDISTTISGAKSAMLGLLQKYEINEKSLIKKMLADSNTKALGEKLMLSGQGIAGIFSAMEKSLDKLKPPSPSPKKESPVSSQPTPSPPPPTPVSEHTLTEQPPVNLYDRDRIVAMLGAKQTLFAGLKLSGLDLSGLDFSGVDFSKAQLDGVNFSKCILNNAQFDQAVLKGAKFSQVVARDASFKSVSAQDTNFEHATLIHCDLIGSDFTKSSLVAVKLDACLLDNVAMFDCNLSSGLIQDCKAHKSHWDGGNLAATQFVSSQMVGATFVGGRCIGTIFSDTDLSKTNFGSVSGNGLMFNSCKADDSAGDRSTVFSRSTFSDTTLTRANWLGVNVQGSTFSHVTMAGSLFGKANLNFCRFETVDARGASFDSATLKNSDLLSSNFMECSFKASILESAKIVGCNLFGANFLQSQCKNLIIDKTNIDRTILDVRQA